MFNGSEEINIILQNTLLTGITDVSFDYNVEEEAILLLSNRGINRKVNKPHVANCSISKNCIGEDFLQRLTGYSDLSGQFIYGTNALNFNDAVITSYKVSLSPENIPKISVNLKIYGDLKPTTILAIDSSIADEPGQNLTPTNIIFNLDDKISAVTNFSYSIDFDARQTYEIESIKSSSSKIVTPIKYSVSADIEMLEQEFENITGSLQDETFNRNISFSFINEAGDILNSFSVPNASLQSQRISAKPSDTIQLSVDYLGYSLDLRPVSQTIIDPPTNQNAEAQGQFIFLSWTNNAIGDSFNTRIETLEPGETNFKFLQNVNQPINQFTYLFDEKEVGSYQYRLRTENTETRKASSFVFAETSVALPAVTNLVYTTNSRNVRFTWVDPVALPETRIYIQKLIDQNWVNLNYVELGVQEYLDFGAASFEGIYSYRIRAENLERGINSAWVDIEVVIDLATLAPITNLNVSASAGNFNFTWTDPLVVSNVTVERLVGQTYQLIDSVGPGVESWDDLGAAIDGVSSFYRFRANYTPDGTYSPWVYINAEFSLESLDPITNLVVASSLGNIDLTWVDSTSPNTEVIIEKYANPVWNQLGTTASGIQVYTDIDEAITAGDKSYRLRALNQVDGTISPWETGDYTVVLESLAPVTNIAFNTNVRDLVITWTDPNPITTETDIFIEKNEFGSYTPLANVSTGVQTYTVIDGALIQGTYQYRLRSENPPEYTYSPWETGTATVTPPLSAPTLDGFLLSGYDLNIIWNNGVLIAGAKTVVEHKAPTESTFSLLAEVTQDGSNPDNYIQTNFITGTNAQRLIQEGEHEYELRTENPANGEFSASPTFIFDWGTASTSIVDIPAASILGYIAQASADTTWTWDTYDSDSSNPNSTMRIEKRLPGQDWEMVGEVTPGWSNLTFIEVGGASVDSSTEYRFRVTLRDTGQSSIYVYRDKPTVPVFIVEPTDFVPTYSGSTDYRWNWTHPLITSDPSRYKVRIERKNASAGSFSLVVDNATNFSYVEAGGYTNSLDAEYRMRVYDVADPSNFSAWTVFRIWKYYTAFTGPSEFKISQEYKLIMQWISPRDQNGNYIGEVTQNAVYFEDFRFGYWAAAVPYSSNISNIYRNPWDRPDYTFMGLRNHVNGVTYPFRYRAQNKLAPATHATAWTEVQFLYNWTGN